MSLLLVAVLVVVVVVVVVAVAVLLCSWLLPLVAVLVLAVGCCHCCSCLGGAYSRSWDTAPTNYRTFIDSRECQNSIMQSTKPTNLDCAQKKDSSWLRCNAHCTSHEFETSLINIWQSTRHSSRDPHTKRALGPETRRALNIRARCDSSHLGSM